MNRLRLVGIEDSALIAGLIDLVRRGNVITSELLEHLGEVEDRLLHAELGFPSLHAYWCRRLA